ncbi:MAG: HlyD family efflux transporter periplasmic adaptor subunit [Lachnospiraceae bacterium]|nr:HlyD family efflux transporter periplasmic adaptor subunit [Lachnospiraceae bacterium]MCI1656414.1 HlyD family efflux transporter periplasmic adaptor subunit [Lachnospiraceae bacterium]MCI2194896.1 HlyD family efflux transporter periplasmic adaptor subunit [Lachnospiraceae bacterium]
MTKKRKMKKKYKVLLILLILAAVVAVTGSLAAKRAAEASRQTIATDKVTRRTLQSSISATGTVTSDSVTNVYGKVSGAAGLKVKSVRVKPGDKVKKGDVICTFDVSDAEQSLKDAKNAQKKQEEAEEQAKESARKSAEASASAAKKQAQSAARQQASRQKAAKKALDSAKKSYQNAQKQYAAAQKQQKQLKDAYEKAKEAAAKAAGTEQETAARAALQQARQSYQSYQQAFSARKSALSQAKSALEIAESAYEYLAGAAGIAGDLSAYSAGGLTGDTTAAASSAADLSGYTSGMSAQGSDSAMKSYQDIIDGRELTAPVSGTVTAVQVEKGGTYAGGAAAVIQDTSKLYISTSVDEYDISNVKKGMRVLIKTDATGDKELEGTVRRISPTASGGTSGASSSSSSSSASMGSSDFSSMLSGSASSGTVSGSSVSYPVEIALKKKDSRLRLDMTARLSLVKQEKKDVLCVPYDAVYTNKKGKKVIYQITDASAVTGKDGDLSGMKEIPVNTGLESGYYTEISGSGIKEGMEIRIPDSGHKTTVEEAFNGMDSTGGM